MEEGNGGRNRKRQRRKGLMEERKKYNERGMAAEPQKGRRNGGRKCRMEWKNEENV